MLFFLQTVFNVSKELSGESFFYQIRTFFSLLYFVFLKKVFRSKSDYKINFKYNNISFDFFLEKAADIAVLREVFVDKEYEWSAIVNPTVILDLGAHIGDTAIYYACLYPDTKIFAIEPSPENYHRLVKNVRQFKNIIPLQLAIGPSDEQVELNLSSSSLGHSVIKRSSTVSSVLVDQMSIPSFLKKHGIDSIDLLKFDIEGAEFEIISNIKISLYAKAVIGELHFDLTTNFTEKDTKGLFDGYTIDVKKIVGKSRYIIKGLV